MDVCFNMTKGYEYNKTWRSKHPEKRYEGKKRYYKKTQNAKNRRNIWKKWEIERILEKDTCDHNLSKELGRSVEAIQIKRCKLKKMKHNQ